MLGFRSPGREPAEDGYSSIEMVIYTPLLIFITFLILQSALAFLGNQAASAAAREGARVARAGGGNAAALRAGQTKSVEMVNTLGKGLLELSGPPTVTALNGGTEVSVTVRGTPQHVIPFVSFPIEQTVQGPVERFTPDK
jgi:hypothetical protein